jgi:hypothetical protein
LLTSSAELDKGGRLISSRRVNSAFLIPILQRRRSRSTVEVKLALSAVQPKSDESCYFFNLIDSRNGREAAAYLTYELFPSPGVERSVLLTDDERLLASDTDKLGFARLRATLEHKWGRTVLTKTLVNSIVDGSVDLPGVRVVVHKFGPVAAYVLSEPVEVRVHGRSVVTNVAVFPTPARIATNEVKHGKTRMSRRKWDDRLPAKQAREWTDKSTRPLFVSDKTEVRTCLSVGLHISLRRYLEDAAEDLHDLRRILGYSELYHRAKRVENTLGQSVRSKLYALVPKAPLGQSRIQADIEAWEIFRGNAGVLYEAAVARSFILYLLNEMYASVGMGNRLEHYRAQIAEQHRKFEALLGTSEWMRIRTASRTLQFLKECQQRYFSGSPNEFSAAGEILSLADSAPELWAAEVCKFGAFVLILRRLALDKPFVRLFLSHHFEVSASECVRDQLADHLAGRGRRRVAAVAPNDLPPGSPLRHILRAAIWMSQGTVAICPRDTSSIVTGHEDKDYRWIARETEYSLLLQKPVLFGIEAGADATAIKRDLGDSSIGYLVNGTKVAHDEARASKLLEEFADRVRASFVIGSGKRTASFMDGSLKANVDAFADDVTIAAVSNLLSGYLRQIERGGRRTLLATLLALGPLGKCARPTLVDRVASIMKVETGTADREFDNMWRQVRDRHFGVARRPVALLELRNGKYCERLTAISSSLRTIMGRARYRAWTHEWLLTRAREFGVVSPQAGRGVSGYEGRPRQPARNVP